MKRTLSAILALLMLLGVACAAIGCSNPVEEQEETANTTAASVAESDVEEVTTESLYDSNGYLKDELDPTLNFNDETVNIFAWEHTLPEFYVEEQSGNIVEDAVYTRNANTDIHIANALYGHIDQRNDAAENDQKIPEINAVIISYAGGFQGLFSDLILICQISEQIAKA